MVRSASVVGCSRKKLGTGTAHTYIAGWMSETDGLETGFCVFGACWCGAGLDLGGRLAKYDIVVYDRYDR